MTLREKMKKMVRPIAVKSAHSILRAMSNTMMVVKAKPLIIPSKVFMGIYYA